MEEFCQSSEDSRQSSAQDIEGMSYFLINCNPITQWRWYHVPLRGIPSTRTSQLLRTSYFDT